MNEPLGIVAERQAVAVKYDRFINRVRLEPADPRVEREAVAFLTEVGEILARRVAAEKARRATMPKAKNVEAQLFAGPSVEKDRTPVPATSIAHVQSVFLEVLYESGYRIKGGFRCRKVELTSSFRGRDVSWPRQVCMSLVYQLCPGPPSTPKIGRAFGGKDHTTVMHALKRTPALLLEWPQLADVHARVLAAFVVPK